MNRTRRTAAAGLTALLAAAACQDSHLTEPVADGLSASAPSGASLAEPPRERPSCDGLPATIWAGMDPALIPDHAVVERLEDDSDHDHDADDEHGMPSGHDEGGCQGEHEDDPEGGDEGHGRWRIVGTNGPDVIVGVRGPDLIDGRNGADVICGLAGPDQIWGGNGDDRIFGGPGPDLIWGERGDDFLDGGRSPDEIWGGPGNDILLGGRGSDLLYGGPGNDGLFGGVGIDVLEDDEGVNVLDPGPQECGGGQGGDSHGS